MIPERYLNFLSEISGKFSIGNFGKLPRPIPIYNCPETTYKVKLAIVFCIVFISYIFWLSFTTVTRMVRVNMGFLI